MPSDPEVPPPAGGAGGGFTAGGEFGEKILCASAAVHRSGLASGFSGGAAGATGFSGSLGRLLKVPKRAVWKSLTLHPRIENWAELVYTWIGGRKCRGG